MTGQPKVLLLLLLLRERLDRITNRFNVVVHVVGADRLKLGKVRVKVLLADAGAVGVGGARGRGGRRGRRGHLDVAEDGDHVATEVLVVVVQLGVASAKVTAILKEG